MNFISVENLYTIMTGEGWRILWRKCKMCFLEEDKKKKRCCVFLPGASKRRVNCNNKAKLPPCGRIPLRTTKVEL